MKCTECEGILFVIKVHDEKNLTKNRLCDVQCINCEKILYYQPYDFGKNLNIVQATKED